MEASKTFEFTQEDYDRIIFKDSLFNNAEVPATSSIDLARNLERLQLKETRLYLHAVTLSDYIRVKRIPRGLRINKGPIIGRDNDTFCNRWSEILNKCSFDLMALTIQEASTNLTRVRDEITSTKEKLAAELTDAAKLQELLSECERQKHELQKEITASKKKKFDRDAADYANGKVYQWRNPSPRHKQGALDTTTQRGAPHRLFWTREQGQDNADNREEEKMQAGEEQNKESRFSHDIHGAGTEPGDNSTETPEETEHDTHRLTAGPRTPFRDLRHKYGLENGTELRLIICWTLRKRNHLQSNSQPVPHSHL